MSAALTSILITVAAKVGAPFVRSLLEKHLGGAAGDLAGTVIDAIAQKAGVPVEDLPGLPEQQLETAVAAVEGETPELVAQYVESQRLATQLQLAEMDKGEATWTWAWRPGWMWFLMILWFWRWVVLPVVDAAVGSTIAAGIDIAALITLTVTFTGLYMGGHTVLRGVKEWKGRQ